MWFLSTSVESTITSSLSLLFAGLKCSDWTEEESYDDWLREEACLRSSNLWRRTNIERIFTLRCSKCLILKNLSHFFLVSAKLFC